jgi:hypothetical protein
VSLSMRNWELKNLATLPLLYKYWTKYFCLNISHKWKILFIHYSFYWHSISHNYCKLSSQIFDHHYCYNDLFTMETK